MKLLYCPNCADVFNLNFKDKKCSCGQTSGHYLSDGLHAVYVGGIPLGFNNRVFEESLINQPFNGAGRDFPAFVIPKKCDTFKKLI
jgi:hypothetical protein